MANPLLSAAEAVELRKRVADAEARALIAERDRDSRPHVGDIPGIADAVLGLAVACGGDLREQATAALGMAFDAGWVGGRERSAMLLNQAVATAEERTRERDQAIRERDAAARALVAALAEVAP